MSSATPMTSSVREVLLKTSAPTGRMDRTAALASSPESTTLVVIPLCSRALATARICCFEARRENSVSASILGPATGRSPGRPAVDGVPMSLTANLSEALVDQRNCHRTLAYRSCAALDRPTADIASGEQPWQVRFERKRLTRQPPSVKRTGRRADFSPCSHISGAVESKSYLSRAFRAWNTANTNEE